MALDYIFSDARGYPRQQMARTLVSRPRTPSIASPAARPRTPAPPRAVQPDGWQQRFQPQRQAAPAVRPPTAQYQARATYAGPQTGAATQPQPPAQAPAGPGYQYNPDPVIQRIQALASADAATARAEAEAARKQVLLDYGDPTMAKTIYSELGTPLDEPFLKSVGDNAFSTTKQLARSRQQETDAAEDRLNKANLFYSGARGKQLGELGQALLQRETEAQSTVRGWLRDIASTLAAREAAAAAAGYDFGDYGGGGYWGGGYWPADSGEGETPPPPPPNGDPSAPPALPIPLPPDEERRRRFAAGYGRPGPGHIPF